MVCSSLHSPGQGNPWKHQILITRVSQNKWFNSSDTPFKHMFYAQLLDVLLAKAEQFFLFKIFFCSWEENVAQHSCYSLMKICRIFRFSELFMVSIGKYSFGCWQHKIGSALKSYFCRLFLWINQQDWIIFPLANTVG